ncbi:PX domain-containing protein EREL1-like isoform X1 [Dioscorea cayenensis subsp. rotundata]|uniref:PX domain-containing protein EREL1-like isoform X1 n=2 Tax=Dioscorea cayennensis subsp. rotundata TaxID=55577 RepID=A0AB40CPB1_DIOCR|nr:PX domain-containing protein EREL1-like isoform X1 [Dioscorea cayenensis subsp. rotundata]
MAPRRSPWGWTGALLLRNGKGEIPVWPHDPRSGWSYCVMIPSWVVQPESGASGDGLLNPIIFYRVQVGIQSPEGVSTSYGILRRFSDFLKFSSALTKALPRKNIPAAPPKHALLRINSSRLLLEERRRALEEWMGKLLSDIDVSRSAPVAAFLELEAAVRSSFQDVNSQTLSPSPSRVAVVMPSSVPFRTSSGVSVPDTLTIASKSQSVASDLGIDSTNELSDLGTPRQGRLQISETGIGDLGSVHDFTDTAGQLANGVLVRDSFVDHPEESAGSKLRVSKETLVLGKDHMHGTSSKEVLSRDRFEFITEQAHYKLSGHARKFSDESIGSDISSIRGSELSNPGMLNSIGDESIDLHGGQEGQSSREALNIMEVQFLNDTQIILPLDQQHKLNRLFTTMKQRLVTAKTDMEDLIARLNQEMAVKEYLTTKVKDLEGELEVTKQKSKENLQQAIVIERERVTRIQWDMDELRRKYLEMESRLKSEQGEKTRAELERTTALEDKEMLMQELDGKRVQIENLQKRLEVMEVKSKSDIEVLVKEVKVLRSSQADLKEALNRSLKEKTELERIIQKGNQQLANAKTSRRKLLHECKILRNRLQECSIDFLADEENNLLVNPSSVSDALDLLRTSDNRIGLLLAEAQLLAQDDDIDVNKSHGKDSSENRFSNGEDIARADSEIRKMLTDLLVDNARLRKQIISVMQCTLETVSKPQKEETSDFPARKTILNLFLER